MHEMSLAISLLEIAEEEAAKNGCNKLLRICVNYGAFSGVMPEALDFCLKTLLAQTVHKDAVFELVETPLKLRCAMCNASFGGQNAIWQACPHCGEEGGHIVEEGRDLILSRIEACREENNPGPDTSQINNESGNRDQSIDDR